VQRAPSAEREPVQEIQSSVRAKQDGITVPDARPQQPAARVIRRGICS